MSDKTIARRPIEASDLATQRINYSVHSAKQNLRFAVADLREGLLDYRVWFYLAWFDIRQRYSRSFLGPLWVTLSTAILIYAMGPIYGRLFGQSVGDYFVYLATSIVTWNLVKSLVDEMSTTFIAAEGFIKQIRKPYTIYVLKVIVRNLMLYAHNFLVIVSVFVFFPSVIGAYTIFFLVGVFLVALNAFWLGIIVGLLSARFRDLPQIVTSITGVAFFLTPIMWKPDMIGADNLWIVYLNPFFHLMEVVRQPLIANEVNWISMGITSASAVIGIAAMVPVFAKFRARVAYWL